MKLNLVCGLHAQRRMLKRDINDEDILRAIDRPKTREVQSDGILITADWFTYEKVLCVAYVPFKNGAFIKTVYWEGEE